jgi:hypothetical protein
MRLKSPDMSQKCVPRLECERAVEPRRLPLLNPPGRALPLLSWPRKIIPAPTSSRKARPAVATCKAKMAWTVLVALEMVMVVVVVVYWQCHDKVGFDKSIL